MTVRLGEAVYSGNQIKRAVFCRLWDSFPWRRVGFIYLDAGGANWMIGKCRNNDISLMSYICRFIAGQSYSYG